MITAKERSGNFTFYRGIHEFSNPSIIKFYAVVAISQKIPYNGNNSKNIVIFSKM